MNKLNEKGLEIAAAIETGLARMTPRRWSEVAALAAEFEDEGEWFAPEFAEARDATKGISWDFDGWRNALEYLRFGSGRIGGVPLLADAAAALQAQGVRA